MCLLIIIVSCFFFSFSCKFWEVCHFTIFRKFNLVRLADFVLFIYSDNWKFLFFTSNSKKESRKSHWMDFLFSSLQCNSLCKIFLIVTKSHHLNLHWFQIIKGKSQTQEIYGIKKRKKKWKNVWLLLMSEDTHFPFFFCKHWFISTDKMYLLSSWPADL